MIVLKMLLRLPAKFEVSGQNVPFYLVVGSGASPRRVLPQFTVGDLSLSYSDKSTCS
jgi:hypothetical protein